MICPRTASSLGCASTCLQNNPDQQVNNPPHYQKTGKVVGTAGQADCEVEAYEETKYPGSASKQFD